MSGERWQMTDDRWPMRKMINRSIPEMKKPSQRKVYIRNNIFLEKLYRPTAICHRNKKNGARIKIQPRF
jgi:hypothetical protein